MEYWINGTPKMNLIVFFIHNEVFSIHCTVHKWKTHLWILKSPSQLMAGTPQALGGLSRNLFLERGILGFQPFFFWGDVLSVCEISQSLVQDFPHDVVKMLRENLGEDVRKQLTSLEVLKIDRIEPCLLRFFSSQIWRPKT